jgi:3'-phosphoadenosine 5'-phosphosulfate (PAPS) 3'-phosphatase
VLEAAGGCVLSLSGAPLAYAKCDRNFRNPAFIAAASPALARRAVAAAASG